MRRALKKTPLLALAALLALALAGSAALAIPAAPAALESLKVQPDNLVIGTFYAGQEASISGEVAAGQDVFLEISGPSQAASFDLKGRVGPFWMNRGLVHVRQAPSLYILLLPQVAPTAEALQGLGMGLAALRSGLQIESPGQDRDQLAQRFVDFQKAAGLYQELPGAVTYEPAQDGRRRFLARLRFPSSLAAGDYRLKATLVEGGAAQQSLTRDYTVSDGAFLKLVKDLAYNRALLFGVLSVIIALVTGALMGVVFKGGKGGH